MTTTSRPVSPAPHGPVESPLGRRCTGDAGEGVISAAIAVLIVAFLGAAMWVGLSSMWDRTETRTNTQVDNIGSDGP